MLLYGQHLALNHLVGTNQIRIFIGTELLDQSSTDNTTPYVQQSTRLNFHCWHTSDRFSKFAFKMGHYNQSELELYRNDTTARAYVSQNRRQSLDMRFALFSLFAGNANGLRIEVYDTRRDS